MRLKKMISWDMLFQMKYGFYFIYAVLCVLYIAILSALPNVWRDKAAAVLIFSDPAAMGMFFMGAIILLEKSQRVLNALAVSPVSPREYVLSKVVSLCIISEIVAVALIIGAGSENIVLALIGTALSSVIFTLIGIIAASGINSLNQFIFITIPIEIICFLPPMVWLFGSSEGILRFYPFCVLLAIVEGGGNIPTLGLLITVLLAVLLYFWALSNTKKMFISLGGAKL